METIIVKNMNLDQIAKSGQCFRMGHLRDQIWYAKTRDHYVEIRQDGESFLFYCEKEEFDGLWFSYFDLAQDYSGIIDSIDKQDTYLVNAAAKGAGIRILKQDLWEMLITFLISQNNNITRIKNSIERLCEAYGEKKLSNRGIHYYGFPTAQDLVEGSLEIRQGLGLGYRDKYIFSMAEWCVSKDGVLWMEALKESNYDQAQSLLKQRLGVGQKVADCICLFGLYQIEAFPMDTHMKQLVALHYKEGFPFNRYEGYAGILQQYMFYSKLNGNIIN